jgi:outer membrane biosynthesis protein TonB
MLPTQKKFQFFRSRLLLGRMITTMPAPYREPEDKTTKWLMIFILLSLLLHAILFTSILLITRFMPAPKFAVNEPKDSKITLSLVPPPPPLNKPIFVPTQPQQNVPHVQRPIESANDTQLQSQSKVARDQNSLMPDINGKPHAPDMRNSPQIQAPKTPQVSTTQPTPRQPQPQKPSPPTPKPQMSTRLTPRPMPPQPKPVPPKPVPPQQQVDPVTGLPVLPPLTAPTMAPPNQSQPLTVSPSQQQVAGSVHGALSRKGDNSPAAMASESGKYKQYIYEVVGSYWYPAVDKAFGTIGVGSVSIRYTIHSDGTLTDVVITSGQDRNPILATLSQQALTSPAPFKPFPPAMVKEVGDSYTDEFSFSTY